MYVCSMNRLRVMEWVCKGTYWRYWVASHSGVLSSSGSYCRRARRVRLGYGGTLWVHISFYRAAFPFSLPTFSLPLSIEPENSPPCRVPTSSF